MARNGRPSLATEKTEVVLTDTPSVVSFRRGAPPGPDLNIRAPVDMTATMGLSVTWRLFISLLCRSGPSDGC